MTASEEAEPAWRRLHPASVLVNLVPQAWRTARAAWPLLLALFVGRGLGARAIDLSLLFIFFGFSVANTLTHWATLRYRVHQGRLEIRSGLLNRRARVMDPARIQNVELVRNLFHKAAGLVELRIETAGDSSTEGLLSALSVGEAARLQGELRALVQGSQHSTAAIEEGAAEEEVLLAAKAVELVAYGLTRRTIGTVAVLTAVGMEILGQVGPEASKEVAGVMRPRFLFAAVLLAFAASWALSGAGSLLRHFRFRLLAQRDRLVTEEGLTTRRRVEIPRTKVQLIRSDEPPLRRFMGYASLLIETAGLGIADGRLRQAEGVIPMVERTRLPELARRAIPGLDQDPWTSRLHPAHPRALYRALAARTGRSLLLVGFLITFFWPWGLVSLLLLPLGVPATWLDWRWQGWRITDNVVLARRGWLQRQSWVVSRDKIQSLHMVQGPLMRWHGLGRVVVRVAGSDVHLPDIGTAQALALLAELGAVRPPPAASAWAEEETDRQDAAHHPGQIGGDARGDGVAQAADPHGTEVDREHVEGGLGRSVEGGGEVADVGVWPVGLEQIGGDPEGT